MIVIPCLAFVASSSLAGCAIVCNRRVRRLDWLYIAATVPFALLALLDLLGHGGYLTSEALFILTRLAYQGMILGISAFFIALLRARQHLFRTLFAVQAVLGVLLAIWPVGEFPGSALPLWQTFNIAVVLVFVTVLTVKLWRRGGTRAWFVLVAAVMALSVMVTDLVGHIAEPIEVSWPQLFFIPILLLLWLVATRRAKFFIASAGSRRSSQRLRAQLAQDLHDGVGGHLATIISTLDTGTANERAIAMRLHECLVELKLLVDGEDDDLSLPALLASLRYRMEPLLKTVGIRLVWNLVPDEKLEAIRDRRARHVLRIAQEAFANVVQHSKADCVTVTCVCRKHGHTLLLEIIDNGIPWPDGAEAETRDGERLGKGIHGMYERAELLGGTLTIERLSTGAGTRIALLVPMVALEASELSDK